MASTDPFKDDSFFTLLDQVTGESLPDDIKGGEEEKALAGDSFFSMLDQVTGVTTSADEPIEPIPEPGIVSEFTGGFSRGAARLPGEVASYAGLFNQLIGFDEAAQTSFITAEQIEAEANATDPKTVTTFEEAVESPGKFALWASGTLGEQIPNVATVLATGGVASLLTRLGLKGLAKEASREAVRKITRRGFVAGAVGGASVLETAQIATENIDPETGLTKAPELAAIGGLAAGALEAVTPFFIASRFAAGVMGPKLTGQFGEKLFRSFLRRGLPTRVALTAGGLAASEAVTESMQEAIALSVRSFVDENFDVLGPAARSRLLNAAAAGLLVGGAFGGVTGAVTPGRAGQTDEELEAPSNRELNEAAEPLPEVLDLGPEDTVVPIGVAPETETETDIGVNPLSAGAIPAVSQPSIPDDSTLDLTPEEIGGSGIVNTELVAPQAVATTVDSETGLEVEAETRVALLPTRIASNAFINASPSLQHRIMLSYDRWIQNIRSPTPDSGNDSSPKLRSIGINDPNYWQGFDQWYIENVAKAIQSSKPVIGSVEKFFDNVARKVRKEFNIGKNPTKDEVASAVENFLDDGFDQAVFDSTGIRGVAAGRAETKSNKIPAPAQSASIEAEAAMNKLGLKPPGGMTKEKFNSESDFYNRFIGLFYNILQVRDKNLGVPGVPEYTEFVELWHNTKMEWISRADDRTRGWNNLGPEQRDGLTKLVFDLDNMVYLSKGEAPRWPTQGEFVSLAQKYKLNSGTVQTYTKIRDDFLSILGAIEESLISDARSIQDDVQRSGKIIEVRADIDRLRSRPYFPHARFGKYTIAVRDNADNLIRYEQANTRRRQLKEQEKLKKEFPATKGFRVGLSVLDDELTPLQGLPFSMLKALKEKLTLSEQQQRDFDELIFAAAPGHSFAHHFDNRDGVAGYSMDAQRAYANYFLYGAGHLARIKWKGSMESALGVIKESERQIDRAGGDAVKRARLTAYFREHFDYIMNPGKDWAGMRSFGFHWWLGFSPVSAMVNLTQVPMVTYPYLSAHYGDAQTLNEIRRAMVDIHKLFNADPKLEPVVLKSIVEGVRQNFIEESQATELAAIAEGSNLQRLLPETKAARGLKHMAYWSAYMFRQAERTNRRTTHVAAVRLAMKNPNAKYLKKLKQKSPIIFQNLLDKNFTHNEAQAFLAGKDAVQNTQFEYSSYARPKFIRGRKGSVLMFFNFRQNMLHFAIHSPGRTKYLLSMLFVSGLMGIPGAEDMEEISKFIGRKLFGPGFDLKKEAAELMQEIGIDKPDLVLHGVSRASFGLSQAAGMVGIPIPQVDLSGSIGQGRIVPGLGPLLQAIDPGGGFSGEVGRTAEEVAGAGFGVAFSILRALSDTNPDNWKRVERALPRAIKGLSKGIRLGVRGEEEITRGGRTIQFDVHDPQQLAEVVAQSIGFRPTRLAEMQDLEFLKAEAIRYWRTRRGMLLTQFAHANRIGNREGIADIWAAIRRFNNQARSSGHPELGLSRDTIRRSLRSRTRSRGKQQFGLGAARRFFGLSADYNRAFSGGEIEVEEENSPR